MRYIFIILFLPVFLFSQNDTTGYAPGTAHFLMTDAGQVRYLKLGTEGYVPVVSGDTIMWVEKNAVTANIQMGGYYLTHDGDDEGIFVSSTGRVGVKNNSSPNADFHVESTDVDNVSFAVERFNGAYMEYIVGGSNTALFVTDGDGFRIFEASSSRNIGGGASDGDLRFDIAANTGNVGIGQTGGSYKLGVDGDINITSGSVYRIDGDTLDAGNVPIVDLAGHYPYSSVEGALQHVGNMQLTATSTLDFSSTAAQTSADLTITVTGAEMGDVVSLGVPNASLSSNSCFTAWVSGADTVTVRFNNYSSGAIDPSSGDFKVMVSKW